MMCDPNTEATSLARNIVSVDRPQLVSNLAIAEQIESALAGFDIERLDHTDCAGVAKRALAPHRSNGGGLAPSGHMDRVPDIR